MKKTSTSSVVETSTAKGCRPLVPSATTVAFLRQFARTYLPAPRRAIPGIVLN